MLPRLIAMDFNINTILSTWISNVRCIVLVVSKNVKLPKGNIVNMTKRRHNLNV
jgi:hypothetical protein